MAILIPITTKPEIDEAEERLRALVRGAASNKGTLVAGFKGGSQPGEGHWDAARGFWAIFAEASRRNPNRYWNAFGLDAPVGDVVREITCEVNVPFAGVRASIAGAFARLPSDGETWFVHRGKIGGGRSGVGKGAFWEHYQGPTAELQHGTGAPTVAVVSQLSQPDAMDQLARFVREVARIKQVVAR